jgi:hypothetical protein
LATFSRKETYRLPAGSGLVQHCEIRIGSCAYTRPKHWGAFGIGERFNLSSKRWVTNALLFVVA